MITSIHQWLVELEEALRRMIGGVFLFFSDWLPTWIYEFIINGLWPVMIRLARVSLLLCLWLSILFCPFLPGLVFKLAWWWKCGSSGMAGDGCRRVILGTETSCQRSEGRLLPVPGRRIRLVPRLK